MKVTIELNDIGDGKIRIKCNPSVAKMMDMCKSKNPPPSIAYTGLMLKQFFEVIPRQGMAVMPGDHQAFATAVDKQKAQRSQILLPGQDF